MPDDIVKKRIEESHSWEKAYWGEKMKTLPDRIAALLPQMPDVDRFTDEACEFANGKVDDAVNWGDLCCIESILCIPLVGDPYFQVTISEASPDASKFQEFVRKYLDDRGFKVNVITEW